MAKVRHIVAFELASGDPEQKSRDAEAVKERLEALASVIPGVQRLDVEFDLGKVPGHWDVVLVSEHDSSEALEAYQTHPRHVEAARFVGSVVRQRAVVDHEIRGQ